MKNKIKSSQEWWKYAEYDLKNAEILFRNDSYVYTVFMCYLALEKSLKSLYTQTMNQVPPKTHNLVYLTVKVNLDLPEQWASFIKIISRISIPTRYPEDLIQLLSEYDKNKTGEILNQTKELIKWLEQKLVK